MDEIKLDKKATKLVMGYLFPEYKGRKITLRRSKSLTFYDTNWAGGTRKEYRCLNMLTGECNGLSIGAPWANPVEGSSVELPLVVVVGIHSYFCGHDMGVELVVAPNNNLLIGG